MKFLEQQFLEMECKYKSTEQDLVKSKEDLSSTQAQLETFTHGAKKLDKIGSVGKPDSDKRGLGYVSNTSNKEKAHVTKFVKSSTSHETELPHVNNDTASTSKQVQAQKPKANSSKQNVVKTKFNKKNKAKKAGNQVHKSSSWTQPPRVYYCSTCGRKGHLAYFCWYAPYPYYDMYEYYDAPYYSGYAHKHQKNPAPLKRSNRRRSPKNRKSKSSNKGVVQKNINANKKSAKKTSSTPIKVSENSS